MSTPAYTVPAEHDGIVIPQDQRDAAADFLTKYTGPNIAQIEWTSYKSRDALKKGKKHHDVRVESVADAAVGVEYKNKRSNRDRVTGDLKWGQWLIYPLLIVHRGALYGRVEVVRSTVRSTYYCDGLQITRKQYVELVNPSTLKDQDNDGDTLTFAVKLQNLRIK